jgi:hypothetical protein
MDVLKVRLVNKILYHIIFNLEFDETLKYSKVLVPFFFFVIIIYALIVTIMWILSLVVDILYKYSTSLRLIVIPIL